mmetsp:Transcript_130661/g.419034  ORF Transcript_130661/g.419034 Transcript_130661/m.419034 type:complete len:676 (+) Transcript_130661:390-2417(+)
MLVGGVSLLGLRRVDLQALQHLRQAHVVLREKHGTALRRREAVAEDVDDVDIRGALGEALLQDSEALVDEGEEQALDDLLIGDLASLVALGLTDLRDLRDDLGVHHLVAALVDEDAATRGADLGVGRLLAEAVVLAEPIRQLVGAHVGLRLLHHVACSLALLPEELLANQVTQGHWPHGHAEALGHPIDLLDGGAVLEELLGLGGVRREHAVAHKTVAIADQDGLLANHLTHGHAGGDRLLAGFGRLHVLQELHHVGRREEVRAHASARILELGGDLVDVQTAGVRADEGVRLRALVQGLKDFLLQGHDLGNGLNDDVAIHEVVVVERRLDEPHVALGLLLRQAPALDLAHPDGGDVLHAAVQPLLLGILEDDRDTLLDEADGDAAAHEPGANDADLLDGRRLRRQSRDLVGHALREEEVPQGGGLHAEEQPGELLALDLAAFLEAHGAAGCADAIDDGLGCDHALGLLRGLVQDHVQCAAERLEAIRLQHRSLGDRGGGLRERELRGLLDDVALGDGVDDTGLEGLGHLHRCTRDEHGQTNLERCQARDALRALSAREQAELHLREADARGRDAHAVVAGKGHLEAAAQGNAVDGGDHGLRGGVHEVEDGAEALDGGHVLEGLGSLLGDFAELSDFGAAAEKPALASDDDGLDLGVGNQLLDVFPERRHQGRGQ